MRFRGWSHLNFICEELMIMLDVRDYQKASVLLAEFVSIVSDAIRRRD
jgi:hypothetical protein